MPTFYFDRVDGFTIERDEVGITCGSAQQAKDTANLAMADMIRDEMPHGTERRFSVRVRSETGASVCHSSAAIRLTTKPA